jgi:hypothetical protein
MIEAILGMSLWKYICQGWVNFENFIHFEVGNGTRICNCFWYDCAGWLVLHVQKCGGVGGSPLVALLGC